VILHRRGLLHQIDAGGLQFGHAPGGGAFIPGLVDVDPHAGALAQGFLDRRHVAHVVHQRAGADLELEVAVALGGDQAFGLVDVPGGVAAGQGPEHRDVPVHGAAEQLVQRLIQALALQVEQGGFDGGLGQVVAAGRPVEPYPEGIDGVRRPAEQQGAEVAVDGQLDAFGAFRAVGQAADGGGFAQTFEAVAVLDPHYDHGLHAHGGHGQLVRAYGRDVDQDGFDGLDGC
jgi:hypothetical protein